MARSFIKQLGTMSMLEDLDLGFLKWRRAGYLPFLKPTLHPLYGLPQLAGLVRLKTLRISGLVHQIGKAEIEWMRPHWPRLYSLEVPLLREGTERGKEGAVLCKNTFSGRVLDFQQWYPGLRVVVPEHCYSIESHGDFVVERYGEWAFEEKAFFLTSIF